MGYIVFELYKGTRSELAIFSNKDKAKEVVEILRKYHMGPKNYVQYEITDLYGDLYYSTAEHAASNSKESAPNLDLRDKNGWLIRSPK